MEKSDHDLQNQSSNWADLPLAVACCRGERTAQSCLFERYKRTMFGVCLRFSESRADAEDLLQEGFVRVFRDICQYRAEGSLEGWVRQVFIRTALDDLKSRKKLPATTDFAQLEYSFSENPDAFPDDLNDPEGAISMLQKLPPGFRAVLNLYVLEEKSHEEIARALGITASTSRSQLARAKEFLRKVILDNLLKMPVFL